VGVDLLLTGDRRNLVLELAHVCTVRSVQQTARHLVIYLVTCHPLHGTQAGSSPKVIAAQHSCHDEECNTSAVLLVLPHAGIGRSSKHALTATILIAPGAYVQLLLYAAMQLQRANWHLPATVAAPMLCSIS
jgi:hypothetical protein